MMSEAGLQATLADAVDVTKVTLNRGTKAFVV
jgi:hypothetical protein